jgi:hypothetical protein
VEDGGEGERRKEGATPEVGSYEPTLGCDVRWLDCRLDALAGWPLVMLEEAGACGLHEDFRYYCRPYSS